MSGAGKHNRYLQIPGLAPVLVTRDPGIIRSILTSTGDREGQFDRDTLPSSGIARATGDDTLLFGNGSLWKRQRRVSASPFGKTALFQENTFQDFETTFRNTVKDRLLLLRQTMMQEGSSTMTLELEPEIKAIMLELLADSFFGTSIPYDDLRERFIPALERVIDFIVHDTVVNPLSLPRNFLAVFSRRYAQIENDFKAFEELTDRVLASRESGKGLWHKLRSDASDEALRSNIKVFLAGALEATTSYATWAISHLARNESWQEKIYQEVESVAVYSPEQLRNAHNLNHVLEETLRLTPSLYFLPRKATKKTEVETSDGRVMVIPQGTHILLDVWHANRHEDFWGTTKTGSPASVFDPARWEVLANQKSKSKDNLHFGFGHGARVCPGKHLGQLEVALVVGVFVKLFRFKALQSENPVKAGVSTKPADGTQVELQLRPPSAGMLEDREWDDLMK